MRKLLNSLFIMLLLVHPALAQEVITAYNDQSLPVLNEELRKIKSDIRRNTTSTTITTLAHGGTETALADPNADRIFFWDESSGTTGDTAFLTVGSGLQISGTTLSRSSLKQCDVYTSGSGNWTASITGNVLIFGIAGGGGGGARRTDQGTSYGGGAAGQAIAGFIKTVTINDVIAYSVGDAGAAGVATASAEGPGGAGGNTTFGTLTLLGGAGGAVSGGLAGGSTETYDGVAGGSGTAGAGGSMKKGNGGNGGNGSATAGSDGGGGGAGSLFGAGGAGSLTGVNGVSGTGWGSGGGGAGQGATTGGAGTSGFLAVCY